jgi:hypothetical protein
MLPCDGTVVRALAGAQRLMPEANLHRKSIDVARRGAPGM